MKDISKNLKSILLRKGLSQKKLSEITELSTSAISDYINENSLMSPSIIQLIAEALNVKPREISSSLETVDIEYDDSIDIPVVGKISCGNGMIAYEEIESYESTPKNWLNGGEHFYLKAKGDSMNGSRIYDGDLLLIRKQPEVEDGEIAAVLIDDEAVLKKVYFRDDTIILQSTNQSYPPLIFKLENKNVTIIGKLKKNVIDY